MKQIELKHVFSGDGSVSLNYKDLILQVCRNHPEGIKIAEMEKAVRVIAVTKKADGVLKLEDADWETLKQYLNGYPFALADETLIEFKHDVDNAKEIEV